MNAALDKAVEIWGTIQQSIHGHAFEHAVKALGQLLSTVRDYPAVEFSNDDIATLKTLSEEVIARIEERVAEMDESSPAQLELASAVYDIRRELEEIERWRRHFHGP